MLSLPLGGAEGSDGKERGEGISLAVDMILKCRPQKGTAVCTRQSGRMVSPCSSGINKKQNTTCASEDAEELELSCTADGNVNGAVAVEWCSSVRQVSKKLKNRITMIQQFHFWLYKN